MPRSRVVLAFFVLVLVSAPSVLGADVRVLATEGMPIARARVTCLDPPGAPSLSGVDGKAHVADGCRRVRCEADPRVPREVEPGDAAVCRLPPAVRIGGALPAGACAQGCSVQIVGSERAEASVAPDTDRRGFRFDAPPLPPGTYRLAVTRTADGWRCAASFGVLGPGPFEPAIGWREPVTLQVRVRGEQDKPRANVPVRAWSHGPHAGTRVFVFRPREWTPPETAPGVWACGEPGPIEARSDEEGRATLSSLDPGSEHLVVAGDWESPFGIDALEVGPFAGQPEPASLTPKKPARLRGRLLDLDDAPVAARADLHLADDKLDLEWLIHVLPPGTLGAAVGAAGTFEIGPLLARTYDLSLLGSEIPPLRREAIVLRSGETLDLGILRVSRYERTRVEVRDGNRRPVAAARVVAIADGGIVVRREARTDAEGVAILSGLPPMATIGLRVEADGFAPADAEELTARDAPFRITLGPAAEVSGRVVDPWGRRVPGAAVRVVEGDPNAIDFLRAAAPRGTRTGDDGTFEFRSLAPGSIRVQALAKGFDDSEPVVLEVAAGKPTREVVLTLRAAGRIRGLVVDESGRPVDGARVLSVESYSIPQVLRSPPLAETVTSGDGRFELNCTACNALALAALAAHYAPAVVSVGDATSDQTLTLRRPARLIVHGPAARGRTLVARVRDGAQIEHSAVLDANGRAELEGLAPGLASANLRSAAWLAPVEFALTSGETAEITLSGAEAVLEGIVTVDGRPWTGALLGLLNEAMPLMMDLAGEAGRYERSLAPGDYIVTAYAAGGSVAHRVALAEGERRRLDLAIVRAWATVRVLGADSGQPLGGARIVLEPVNPSDACAPIGGAYFSPIGDQPGMHLAGFDTACSGGVATTRDDGTALVPVPGPGEYVLTVRREGYRDEVQHVAMTAGTTALSLVLQPAPASPPSPAQGPDAR